MGITECAKELSWLSSQIEREVEALEKSEHPILHWVLIYDLALAAVKQVNRLGGESFEVVCTVAYNAGTENVSMEAAR